LERIEERADHVAVSFDGKTLHARFLVGADGANSRTRRLLNAGQHFQRGFAIEGLVSYADIGAEPVPEFLFGVVRNGYGWLFPKRSHVNVGIYSCDSSVLLRKQQLRDYALERLGTDRIADIVGFPLGFGGRRYASDSERTALVGDAAGFCEPLLGEGIHNALKSGQAAAGAIIESDRQQLPGLREAYRRAIASVVSDLSRCERMRDFFYGHLAGIGATALRLRIARTALMQGFAAGKTMRELTNRFALAPFFASKTPPSLRDFLAADPSDALR
jgi:flavin-dependent dehydrogenase